MVTLVRQPSAHHVRRLLRRSLNHVMRNVASNGNCVFLNDCDTASSREMTFIAHALVVLLRLDDVAAEHLWVFNFNLRIVENIIIVVYVLYYFNWLVLLLLRFRRTTSTGGVMTVDLTT